MSNPYSQIHTTPLTQIDTVGPKEALGSIRIEKGKTYKYVQVLNSGGTQALVAGDAVAYFAATGQGIYRCVTRVAEADAAPVAAGIVQVAVPGVSGTSYYLWIQTKGLCTLNQAVGGAPAAGDEVMHSTATFGKLDARLYSGTTPNIKSTGAKAGNMVNTTTLVVLDCTGAN